MGRVRVGDSGACVGGVTVGRVWVGWGCTGGVTVRRVWVV